MREMLASTNAMVWADLFRHMYSARTYVVLGALALATSACVFLIGGLIDSDFASLELLYTFLPVVAIFAVPALGADDFAADGSGREFELMLSLPLSDREIVLGKWLSGCLVLTAGLFLTLPIALTVAYLGDPDWGSAAAGLAGAILLLAAFHAVTLLVSAVTGRQTTAYLLSLVLLLALSAVGSDALANVMPLPATVSDALRLINPRLALERLATGRVEIASLLTYVAVTGSALLCAELAIKWRREARITAARGAGLLAGMPACAAVVVVIGNLVLAPVHPFDATAERLYTFSAGTIDIARTAPRGTTIEFYLTAAEPAVPAHIRDHARRVRQTLELLAKLSGGKVALRLHDVTPDSEAEWQAVAAGLRRMPLAAGGSFVLGAVVQNGARRHVLAYFDAEHAGLTEYDLASALSRIGRQKVPRVGILSPLLAPSELTEAGSRFAFLKVLRATNDVAIIPFFADDLPQDLDALVVIGEGPIKPSLLRAIDGHVMRGKGLVALLDPLTRLDKSGRLISQPASASLNTMSDLIARYGMAFDAQVVGDAENAALVAAASGQPAPYPFFVVAGPGQLQASNAASAQIRRLLFLEPGSLRLDSNAQALVTTSPRSGAATAAALAGSPADNAAAFSADGKRRVLAAVAGRSLTSAFGDGGAPTPVSGGSASSRSASVIAVADVDWVLDGAALSGADAKQGDGDNDNLVFFGNLVEAAGGDPRLTTIHSRTPQSRRFTRIAAMLSAAQARYQSDDAVSRAAIEKVENAVAEILKATKARSIADLPPDVRSRIGALYSEIMPARKRQREIRVAMRQSIEQLGFKLTAVNLAFGPLAAFMLWGLSRLLQQRGNSAEAPRETSLTETR